MKIALAKIGCAEHGTLAVVPARDWNRAAMLLHSRHSQCHMACSSYEIDRPTSFAEALAMAAAMA